MHNDVPDWRVAVAEVLMLAPLRIHLCWNIACTAMFMLVTIAVILLLLWVLGMATAMTIYGFLHLFLILAVAILAMRIIEGN